MEDAQPCQNRRRPREGNEAHGELVPFPGVPAVPAADTSYEIALDEDPAPSRRAGARRRRDRAAGPARRAPPGHPRAPAYLGRGTRHGGQARRAAGAPRRLPRPSGPPATCSRPPAGRCRPARRPEPGDPVVVARRAGPAAVAGRHHRRQPGIPERCTRTRRTPAGPAAWSCSPPRAAVAVARRAHVELRPVVGVGAAGRGGAAAAGPGRAPGGQADRHARRRRRRGSGCSTPTSCCAPTTRPGSATRTSRASRSRSARRWPATATAPGCWSTCPTARAWRTR